jgi:hypothetical protein
MKHQPLMGRSGMAMKTLRVAMLAFLLPLTTQARPKVVAYVPNWINL